MEQYQHLSVGDWAFNMNSMFGIEFPMNDFDAFKVQAFKTNRWLVWAKADSTWSWLLKPAVDGQTRLILRIRARPVNLFWTLFMEFGDPPMARRMLKGIKARAERTDVAPVGALQSEVQGTHHQLVANVRDGAFRRAIALILDAFTAIPLWAIAPLMRGWHLRWGATEREVHDDMPGDEVVPRAQFNATRAITIDAAPENVWPWIVQLGYRRAGFYTYDLIDNVGQPSAGLSMGNATIGDVQRDPDGVRGLRDGASNAEGRQETS